MFRSKKKAIPSMIRHEAWIRTYGRTFDANCIICDVQITCWGNWHASHIVPEVKGGHSCCANLIACCATCNLRMGKQNLYKFVSSGYGQEHVLRIKSQLLRHSNSITLRPTIDLTKPQYIAYPRYYKTPTASRWSMFKFPCCTDEIE